MPACDEQSVDSVQPSTKNDVTSATSEPGPSDAVVPKSAIDVALELIAQAEIEALEAARIAALNKPRPRGRPPLHRKIAEAESNSTANLPTMVETQKSIQQKCYDDAQVRVFLIVLTFITVTFGMNSLRLAHFLKLGLDAKGSSQQSPVFF
ncbi:hypothetical protein ANCCAN_29490 [Ancylostoma caninum]|uniref:Uncharacterized protein n=1 Tax=Ancylostoma caninum TaxID=29170 RepID=A0A368F3P0_ANCCA|nr:hypothetical protein ANCCAN_29490 [Ancylostoma caninum]